MPSDICSSIQLLPAVGICLSGNTHHITLTCTRSAPTVRANKCLFLRVSLGRWLYPHPLTLVFSYGHVHIDRDLQSCMAAHAEDAFVAAAEPKAMDPLCYAFLQMQLHLWSVFITYLCCLSICSIQHYSLSDKALALNFYASLTVSTEQDILRIQIEK